MKNFKQFITIWNCIIRLYPIILSSLFSSSNLYSIHLLSGILYNMADSVSIYLFALQYESFLVIGFINRLDKNLSILRLVVSDLAK